MLRTTQIPVGVSTQDCLSWSSDGELAIAAGEEVYLLLPRNDGHQSWTHVRFRVNTFTYDEWPVRPQASFANMSIGEEQGRVTIVSIEWSPPGLAKYRRSILVVLTTNLVLSLWAPGPDPRDPEGWKRVWIVNGVAIPQSISPNSMVRSLERVRSMAWVPPNGEYADQESPFSTRKWGIPLLAVADDNNGICILIIRSPFTSANLPWDVQVLAYQTITPDYRRASRPSLLSEALNAKHFIERTSFKNWNSAGELPVTVLSSGVFHQIRLIVSLKPSVDATMTDVQVRQANAGKHYASLRQVPSFMQASMKRQKAKYSNDSQLSPDNVVLKTWGVDYSGSLGAICVTCHPAKMVEYQAPAADSATIIFGAVDGEDASQTQALFPWQSTRHMNYNEARQTINSTILSHSSTSQTCGQPLKLTRFDLKVIYTAIIAHIVINRSATQQMPNANDLEAALVIMEDRSGIKLQLERTLITSSKRSPEDSERLLNEWAKERSLNGFGPMAPGVQLLDNCPFCGDGYLGLTGRLEGSTQAYCPNNHPFGRISLPTRWRLWLIACIARCALTLLPILEPGCSKYCSTCKREFINEELHPEISLFQGGQSPDSDQIKPSLANLLFAKFDICPYCDGKFCE